MTNDADSAFVQQALNHGLTRISTDDSKSYAKKEKHQFGERLVQNKVLLEGFICVHLWFQLLFLG
jgi:hypothetical protein